MNRLIAIFAILTSSLFANPENACLLMSNAGGTGTGFILKGKTGFWLISNQHVIDGGAPHRYEKFDGTVLKPLKGWIASDRDIVMYSLEGDFPYYFELDPEMDTVALGEEVIIYGNSLGQGMRISEAKIVQKSRGEIEVSGGIVPGNSGGPIIRKKNGKLIAVSTYATVQKSNPKSIQDYIEAAGLPKVRFYGVRIDTLQNPIDFDLRKFLSESAQISTDDKQLDRAVIFLVLLSIKLGGNPSPEMRAFAQRADQGHHRTFALLQQSGLYPGTYSTVTVNAFRAAADGFFVLSAKPTSYIHKSKQENLIYDQKFLWNIYVDLLRYIPVR